MPELKFFNLNVVIKIINKYIFAENITGNISQKTLTAYN